LPLRLVWIVDLAQARQLQPVGDLLQQILVDVFDGEHDGRAIVAGREISIAADRDRCNDRRPAGEMLDEGGAPPRLARIVRKHGKDVARQRGQPTAQQIEAWRELRPQVADRGVSGSVEELVFDLIGSVDDDNDIVVEEGREPCPEAAFYPLRIVVDADRKGRALRPGDALQLAQDPLAARGDRPLDQLLLACERDLVGPLARNSAPRG
jgi:hypothetical protein